MIKISSINWILTNREWERERERKSPSNEISVWLWNSWNSKRRLALIEAKIVLLWNTHQKNVRTTTCTKCAIIFMDMSLVCSWAIRILKWYWWEHLKTTSKIRSNFIFLSFLHSMLCCVFYTSKHTLRRMYVDDWCTFTTSIHSTYVWHIYIYIKVEWNGDVHVFLWVPHIASERIERHKIPLP